MRALAALPEVPRQADLSKELIAKSKDKGCPESGACVNSLGWRRMGKGGNLRKK